ncbi:MAG: hypothetical protein WD135_05200 [Ferruginibacter sp.]
MKQNAFALGKKFFSHKGSKKQSGFTLGIKSKRLVFAFVGYELNKSSYPEIGRLVTDHASAQLTAL